MKSRDLGHGMLAIDGFLSAAECTHFIALSERLGFENVTAAASENERARPGARDNDRTTLDDPDLARRLWQRAAPAVPEIDGAIPAALNPRFRIYRYDPGQRFTRHRDGIVRQDGMFSLLTILFYLNDDYEGGETRFTDLSVAWRGAPGQAFLFPQRALHEGAEVTRGRKYLLRSDVLFRRPPPWERREVRGDPL